MIGRVSIIVQMLVPLICGVLAVALGQDASWDFRNYHWYNGWAAIHGRLGTDILPAQIHTFFNPGFHAGLYAVAQVLPPPVVTFLLGVLPGLAFPLLVQLARHSLALDDARLKDGLAVLVGFLGISGAGALALLGTSFMDNILAVLVLAALLVLVAGRRRLLVQDCHPALQAGLICGLAAGLKLTAGLYPLGIAAALLLLPTTLVSRVRIAAAFSVAVLIGTAITGGWWMVVLAQLSGNPLLPFLNELFQSDWLLAESYRDPLYTDGRHPAVTILVPLLMIAESGIVAEPDAAFTEARLAVAWLALIGGPLAGLILSRGHMKLRHGIADPVALRLLLGSFVGAYLVWLLLFSIYRYALALEMLAPLVTVLALGLLPVDRRARIAAAVIILVIAGAMTRFTGWGRADFADAYVAITLPGAYQPAPNTMVLMAGVGPLSYVIPQWPGEARFLRIQGLYHNTPFMGPDEQIIMPREAGLEARMRHEVTRHQGPLWLMFRGLELYERVLDGAARYGVVPRLRECAPLQTSLDRQVPPEIVLCPAYKPDDVDAARAAEIVRALVGSAPAPAPANADRSEGSPR